MSNFDGRSGQGRVVFGSESRGFIFAFQKRSPGRPARIRRYSGDGLLCCPRLIRQRTPGTWTGGVQQRAAIVDRTVGSSSWPLVVTRHLLCPSDGIAPCCEKLHDSGHSFFRRRLEAPFVSASGDGTTRGGAEHVSRRQIASWCPTRRRLN